MGNDGTLEDANAWAAAEEPHAQDADVRVLALTTGMLRADETAYREFSQTYSNRLFRYLLVVTRGDEANARELLQQTMIKVARKIKIFPSEPEFWNWLAVIARNCAADDRRKRESHWSMLTKFWERLQTVPNPPPENRFSTLLSGELDQLSSEERLLLERKYIDNCSVRDLAAELDTTEKSVESKLSRLREKLRTSVIRKMKYAESGE